MKLGRWSTAAGSNNASPPNGWPEGQLPSTVNDCAREMMASIRTAALDLQFIDQDYTPTFITSTSFSVPGNQTSAIHIGRRLKLFDATAGVQQVIYATVQSVSFTAVTTIQIAADSGSLTSSLSSFGLSIISNVNNGLPRASDLTISSLAVGGGMSISGAAAFGGAVQMGSTLSVSGAAVLGATLSVSATACAAIFVGPNVAKAYVNFHESAGGTLIDTSYNISTVIRSAVGVVKITFINALNDAVYLPMVSVNGATFTQSYSLAAASCKFTFINTAIVAVDGVQAFAVFYHV